MAEPFGSFGWICRHAPLPQCNLFFTQLFESGSPTALTTLFPNSSAFFRDYDVDSLSTNDDTNALVARKQAGTGIGQNCSIPHAGQRGSVADIALIVLSAVSALFALWLFWRGGKRRAAVGRTEFRYFLIMFALHNAFQIVDMSSVLQQGTVALVVISAIHIGLVASLFWILLGNAIVALQIVEDGTPAALVPLTIVAILFFVPSLYISLDTGFSWTNTSAFSIADIPVLKAISLFVLTLLWPALAAVLYVAIMMFVVFVRLREVKPAMLQIAAFALFVGAQVIFFVASQPLCDVSNRRINGAFLATLLNSAAVGTLYFGWKSITEEDWIEEPHTPGF